MTVINRGSLPIPSFGVTVPGGGTTGISNVAARSAKIPINLDSYSKLGVKRTLTNISCIAEIVANYGASSGFTPSGTLSTNATISFNLYKNLTQLVYSSTAQLDLPPFSFTAGIQEQYTQYGIFSDFVNPIPLDNSDLLYAEIVVTAVQPRFEDPYTVNNGTGGIVTGLWILGYNNVNGFAIGCGVSGYETNNVPQGVITYEEDDGR